MKLGPVLRFKNITHSHVMTGGPDTGETDRLTFDPGRTYGCVKMCMVQVQWYVRVYWCAFVLVQWYDKHVWCRQWCVFIDVLTKGMVLLCKLGAPQLWLH